MTVLIAAARRVLDDCASPSDILLLAYAAIEANAPEVAPAFAGTAPGRDAGLHLQSTRH